MKFIKLTESRKDRDTQKPFYADVMVNASTIRYVQDKANGAKHTYIAFLDKSFMFVKESFAEIEKAVNST